MKLNKNIFVEKPLCINFNHIKYIKKLINYKKLLWLDILCITTMHLKKFLILKGKIFFKKFYIFIQAV